jgi:multiple sugar transport system permease protein
MGVAYAAPTAVFVAVFFITPLLLVARMSLSSWPLLTGNGGLNFPKNYLSIWKNALFGPAVVFTIEYTLIVTVLLIGLGLGLALLVQERGRWVDMLRTVILLPVSLGLAAASLLFWGFYSPSIGPINPILEQLGLIHDPISFLGTSLSALLSTSFLIVWKYSGLYMLIFLVGLQAIPDDLFEAAALDGASRIQVFRHITLPLLRPSLALALILCVTGSLLAFDQFYILTKGAPDNSTVTVVQLIYREAFQKQNLGTSAAISIMVLVALLIPLYVLLNGLRLQNSLIGLSLVLAMFQLPFATYMMRISFEAVPRELEESALVDGCGTFSVLWRILLPSVRPGLITVGLFAFLAAWSDFLAPLILLTDSAKQTLPLAVANLRQQTMGAIDYGATEAGVVVMAVPCLILFLLLQRYYVRGFTSGAVKG